MISKQTELDLLVPCAAECPLCGHIQHESLEPGEWTWVVCGGCHEGYHINPTQPEAHLIQIGG